MDDYITIRTEASDEFTERRSRFIGHIAPVETEDAANEFIAKCRSEHRDATHNVYAYLLRGGTKRRYSDDGEPQGTAGMPVLECISREGICDVAVVVTRYFGGVLLGAGGLVRAYSHAAKLAITAAGRVTMRMCAELELETAYELYGGIARLLPEWGAKTLDVDFGATVKLRVLLPADSAERFESRLTEQTAARAAARVIGRRYACIE